MHVVRAIHWLRPFGAGTSSALLVELALAPACPSSNHNRYNRTASHVVTSPAALHGAVGSNRGAAVRVSGHASVDTSASQINGRAGVMAKYESWEWGQSIMGLRTRLTA